MSKLGSPNIAIYEVSILIRFNNDKCCCSSKLYVGDRGTPIECLNPALKGHHYIRFLNDGNVIVKIPSPKACPFSKIARELPIHIKNLIIFPKHALLIVIATKSSLRKLYKELNRFRDVFTFKIVETKNLSTERKSRGALTNKQKLALITAYHIGYFNSSDKAKIREVAEALGRSQSTVSDLIRRGLKNLLDNIDLDSI